MARVRGALAVVAASAIGVMMTACGSSGTGTTPPPTTYTLTVDSTNPSSQVSISVGNPNNNVVSQENTPFTETAAPGTLYVLTAPATVGSNSFTSWTGCTSTSGTGNIVCNVTLNSNMTVTANYSAPTKATPTVTFSAPTSVQQGEAFSATITVAAPAGDATPTGSVSLTSSGLSALTEPLTNGQATINVPADSWAVAPGTYTVTGTYTPDSSSSSLYNSATGTTQITVTAAPPTTYTLTVDSTNPASGVGITVSPNDVNSHGSGSTPLSLTYDSGAAVTLTAPATSGSNTFSSWSGCTSTSGTGGVVCSVTMSANTTVTANYSVPVTLITPTVAVSPSSASVTTEQSLPVTITVSAPSGDPVPSGSVVLSNNNGYTSSAVTLNAGTSSSSAVITVPGGQLPEGLNTLTATYTPDNSSSATYTSATGSHPVTVNTLTPTVTVTPQPSTIDDQQSLQVTVAVSVPTGDPTPTGSVTVTSGTYSSGAETLTSGSVTFTIAAGTLANGSDTLTATYTPDSTSSGIYGTATGTSSPVTVGAATNVTVDQSSVGPATTDKILGVNLESWYDVVQNANSGVLSGLQAANMQSLRWPGGSWSDQYHWNNGGTPYMCTCSSATSCTANDTSGWGGDADEAFGSFETNIAKAGNGFDLALTADYGTNEACNGGGDPAEAAAWAAAAVTNGYPASHITVGNEEYGGWETDLHASAHDPTTYAAAVTGTSGYYDSIKTAITNAGGNPSNTLVGVVVDADGSSTGWDHTVLGNAAGSYDFVEYHYYPQYQGESVSDSSLLTTYVQNFTANINTIKNELSSAGEAGTPIYVGELGANSGNGGTQNWSITQALYAGQILGEAMKNGVSRLTWWDGYGNCQGVGSAQDSDLLPPNNSTVYGWQDWGAQNIFGTGSTDVGAGCNDGSVGTLSPTAMAFQLFSHVAVTGQNVLTATVSGDTSDVRAYAATHSGGTALVLFNLNKTTPESVNITLTSNAGSQTSATDLQVITYDKEMYDYTNVNCQADQTGMPNGNNCTYDSTHNYSTVDWVQQPVTKDYGNVSLPYTLVLQPWSMNVVIINN